MGTRRIRPAGYYTYEYNPDLDPEINAANSLETDALRSKMGTTSEQARRRALEHSRRNDGDGKA